MWKSLFIAVVILLQIFSGVVYAQGLRVPNEGYKQCAGIAFSTGAFFDKPAVFIGLGFDYAYIIKEKWVLLGGLAFDSERKTKLSEGETRVINTLTPNVAVGYLIKPRLAVGAGVGKGLWDTDNPEKKMKYTTSGNLTVGVLCAYTLYVNGPHGIDVTGGIERGLITVETNFTVEIGYGYSF
jgi:hypothetical protein